MNRRIRTGPIMWLATSRRYIYSFTRTGSTVTTAYYSWIREVA